MTDLVLDDRESRIRIHTYAEGLFARLAHDLELVCGAVSGVASKEARAATIEASVAGIEVAGVLKDGHVDDRTLSAGEKRDILDKMRREVFHAGADARVRIEATLADGGAARVRIVMPNGRAVEATSRPDVRDQDGVVRASGSLDLSLAAIGSDVVKGPMNAFRVKDRVVVQYDVVLRPQPA